VIKKAGGEEGEENDMIVQVITKVVMAAVVVAMTRMMTWEVEEVTGVVAKVEIKARVRNVVAVAGTANGGEKEEAEVVAAKAVTVVVQEVRVHVGVGVEVENGRMIVIVTMKNKAMVLDLAVAVGDTMMIMTTNEEEAGREILVTVAAGIITEALIGVIAVADNLLQDMIVKVINVKT
jgi:hypothetical protein